MKKFKERLPRLCAALLCAALLVGVASCSNASGGAALPTAPGGSPAGTPGGNNGAATYKVNIAASIEHGSVTASPTSAAAGTEITLTATADQNYVWSSYTVTDASGAAVPVSAQGKFTMPASDVTVSATFVVGVNATLSNLASVISALTQDSTIAMTGQVTSGDLATIKSALLASQHMIKLDLRGVTGLDSLPLRALDQTPKLQSISLPEGLASIGHNAFTGCENLESLYLPASFSSFDEHAFDMGANSKLSSINVADANPAYSSVDGVLFSKDKKTLVKCPQGKSGAYTVPEGVTAIGSDAFFECKKLTGIVLPEGLQEIGQYAFRYTNIASMTIPSSVITIYDGVFSGNSSLTSLTFSDTTGWYSTNNSDNFRKRTGGTAVSAGDMNAAAFKNGNNDYYYKAVATSQNVAAFVQKVAALTGDSTVKLEGQIKQTDLAAIYKAINEASYKVKLDMSGATGLSSLPEQAFIGCFKLQEIILPEGIASIGNQAFSVCNVLESVSLPASVTSIGRDAFDPPSLLSVNVAQGNAVYSSVDGVLFSKDKSTLIFCPKGKGGAYAIPSGVKVIGKSAFKCCGNLTGIAIPDGVEKIGEEAFSNLGIASLELPDSVTVIEYEALRNCSSLTSLKLSANLTKIGDLALSGIKVESLALPASVTSIGRQAFQSCGSLKSLVIPASVTSIGQYVFDNCSALTSVEFKAPSGWKRTTNPTNWENRTGGEAFDFSATEFAQNATSIKTTYSSNYWYK
ncbi:MAG: leucine-rich repeat domain-containing protein [Treponema sp.]|nr:leucine-rich repeat domain-containing protein [Treponema sp.]